MLPRFTRAGLAAFALLALTAGSAHAADPPPAPELLPALPAAPAPEPAPAPVLLPLPAPVPPPAVAPVAPADPASAGLMLGASVGYFAPAVGIIPLYPVSPGVDVGVTVGVRFARYFYLGAAYHHGFVGATGGYVSGGSDDYQQVTGASTDYVGLEFASLWELGARLGIFTEAGVGYRVYELSLIDGGTMPDKLSLTGWESTFGGLGLELNPGNGLRIVLPEATVQVGKNAASVFLGASVFFDFVK